MKKTALSVAATMALLGASPALAADMPGKAIFGQHCTMCHAIDHKKVGPAVKDMSKDATVLKRFITDGKGMMPSFGHRLTAEQIDQVVAYLQSQESK